MDIATRLKEFIDYSGLQSTQFADACGIPRPSFSQLLRGRNRKVSDEVITKIHESFPQLSVLWLMFGEGDMLTSGNIAISEAENGVNPPPPFSENPANKLDTMPETTPVSVTDFNQSMQTPMPPRIDGPGFVAAPIPFTVPVREAASMEESNSPEDATPTSGHQHRLAKEPAVPPRRVVSIMVFYSDQSFETFIPEK
ncbi:helix-turn-helix transcriptional regulator [uncultured Muribaculum sp.]|uniref:helix-turn-helix domain-containing protein n=1 Tax=uncultured Muribaculum sp. TaxID=1918613 RepID=UPI0025CE82D1|nr:helix-turn-helix transcriptional regulator [uncultured Muribaculum sp.]